MDSMGTSRGLAPQTELAAAPDRLLARVQLLAARARAAGLTVSVEQVAAFVHGMRLLDVTERSALQRLAAVTMASRQADLPALRTLVDATFPGPRPEGRPDRPGSGSGDIDDLREELLTALRAGDVPAARLLGASAADLAPAAGGDRSSRLRYGQQRVLRAMDLSALLHRAMTEDPADGEAGDGLTRKLAQADRDETLRAFELALLEELQRRAVANHDTDSPGAGQEPMPDLADGLLDADPRRMSRQEMAALAEQVRPLARRLAARVRRRRRTRRGRLDMRRTQRRALATGGIPLEVVLRRRRPSQPRLLVLCDVSGSMADHARFVLALLSALAAELPRLRSFVFVDGVAEVTDLLARRADVVDARVLLSAPGVVVGDGHSAYAGVLGEFTDRYGRDVTADTTLVILGDARTRGEDPRADLLAGLARRARRVYWLNPEPEADWDTGDSTMSAYRPHCTAVAEVRTLRQLGAWVLTLS